MMMRVARAEEKLESEHNTVGTLVNHTKQMEQALLGNQQQLLSRREQLHVHVERVKDDMEDVRESQEQLQKNMRALIDDVRTMKSKHEVQTVQFGTLVQEIRQRMKKIEGDTNSAVSAFIWYNFIEWTRGDNLTQPSPSLSSHSPSLPSPFPNTV